jgi:hypothetical protein
MGAAIFNLAMGALAIVSGLYGYTLPFTSSSAALMGVGGLIAGLGVYQLIGSRQ